MLPQHFRTVVLEKTLESPLDCTEIQPVHPKGDQPWIFIGRTHAEAETPILWPPDAKNWLTGPQWTWLSDWITTTNPNTKLSISDASPPLAPPSAGRLRRSPGTRKNLEPLPLLVPKCQYWSCWCSYMKPEAAIIHDLVSVGTASALSDMLESSKIRLWTPNPWHRGPRGWQASDFLLGSLLLLGTVYIRTGVSGSPQEIWKQHLPPSNKAPSSSTCLSG